MKGCLNTPEIPCFTKMGYPWGALVHTSSCHGADSYFCRKVIPWSLFVLLPCLPSSVTAGRDPAACEVASLLVVVSDFGLEPSRAQFCLFLAQFTRNIPLQ